MHIYIYIYISTYAEFKPRDSLVTNNITQSQWSRVEGILRVPILFLTSLLLVTELSFGWSFLEYLAQWSLWWWSTIKSSNTNQLTWFNAVVIDTGGRTGRRVGVILCKQRLAENQSLHINITVLDCTLNRIPPHSDRYQNQDCFRYLYYGYTPRQSAILLGIKINIAFKLGQQFSTRSYQQRKGERETCLVLWLIWDNFRADVVNIPAVPIQLRTLHLRFCDPWLFNLQINIDPHILLVTLCHWSPIFTIPNRYSN